MASEIMRQAELIFVATIFIPTHLKIGVGIGMSHSPLMI